MKKNVRAMTECSIMIALSTVLSLIKLAELPYGGSVTIASMLPIAIAVFRHGGAWGFATALVNAFIQMLLGLNNFSYFTTWQSILALAIFDYVLAFAVFSLSGIFKKVIKNQGVAITLGVLLASILRYACHVISGATVWAGLSIPDEAALLYSFSYNATYMIPETLVLALCTLYVCSVIDFTKKTPVRVASNLDKTSVLCYIGAGFSLLVGLIIDIATVFPTLQDPKSGEFIFGNIANANFTLVAIASSVCVAVSAILVIFAVVRAKTKKNSTEC